MIAAGFQGQLKKPLLPEQLIEDIRLVLTDEVKLEIILIGFVLIIGQRA